MFGQKLPASPTIDYYNEDKHCWDKKILCKPYDTKLLALRIAKADDLHHNIVGDNATMGLQNAGKMTNAILDESKMPTEHAKNDGIEYE